MNIWTQLANVVTDSQTFGYSTIRSLVSEGSDMNNVQNQNRSQVSCTKNSFLNNIPSWKHGATELGFIHSTNFMSDCRCELVFQMRQKPDIV